MKKFLSFILICSLFLICLSGCAKRGKLTRVSAETDSTTLTERDTEADTSEDRTFDDIEEDTSEERTFDDIEEDTTEPSESVDVPYTEPIYVEGETEITEESKYGTDTVPAESYDISEDTTTADEETTTADEETTTAPATVIDGATEMWDKSNHLIIALSNYLRYYHIDYEPVSVSIPLQMELIAEGYKPLLVSFDPEDFYFVCAYFYTENCWYSDDESMYCCVDNYIWVRYEDADNIRDSYDGADFVAAFQVNKASSVTDISDPDGWRPHMGHFKMFKTSFVDGRNTSEPLNFGETFVYLNSSPYAEVYHSTSLYTHEMDTLPHSIIDGKLYILVETQVVSPDGTVIDYTVNHDYNSPSYDKLVNEVLNAAKLSVEKRGEYAYYYKLVPAEDFLKCISPK